MISRDATKIDPWFIDQMQQIVEVRRDLEAAAEPSARTGAPRLPGRFFDRAVRIPVAAACRGGACDAVGVGDCSHL